MAGGAITMDMINYGNRLISRLIAVGMLVFALAGNTSASEIILTSDNLNEALKQMQRYRQQMENAEPATRADALYHTGVLAKDLAAVLSEEVALYDSQQGGLIQLALDRSRELDVNIDWVADKKRFIYDGNAFKEYGKLAPAGTYAGDSAYFLLETEFVLVAPDDPAALQQAAEHKKEYLQQFAKHDRAAEVALLLAIDYRDLWRLSRAAGNTDTELRYRDQTRNQFRYVIENYPGGRQAKIASGLQTRFEAELQQVETAPAAAGSQ